MSYDAYVEFSDGREAFHVGNYTSNARDFFGFLLGTHDWRLEVEHRQCRRVWLVIEDAVKFWESLGGDRQRIIQKRFFPNGWGDCSSAVSWLANLSCWLMRLEDESGVGVYVGLVIHD